MIDYRIYKLRFKNNELEHKANFIQSASSSLVIETLVFSFNYFIDLFNTLFIDSLSTETLQSQFSAFYNFQRKEQLQEQNSPKIGTDRQSDAVENTFPAQLIDSSDDFLFPRSYKIYI